VQKWSVPVRWTTSHEHGIGPDGSIYTFAASGEFVRLDGATGALLNTAGVLPFTGSGNLSAKTAVDAAGRVYLSNGWASSPIGNGRLWAFSADLSVNHFTLSFQRQNQGGPALAAGGTLVMCDLNAVGAWRDVATPYCTAKPNSLGCVSALAWSGVPSASSPAAFSVTVSNVLNQVPGIFFYGTSGPLALPFLGGSLCVNPPLTRTPVASSNGNPPPDDCSGAYQIDFNAYVQSGIDPSLAAGVQVNVQCWSRDPLGSFTVGLSSALQFVIGP
jgi:hypothetical protein